MTDSHTRSLLKAAALTALASAALVGCGKKEEPAPAPAPAPAAAAPAPAKAEPLKVAFAYVGPVGDGGWTYAHDNGRKAVEKEFGDKVVTSFVESVPESADAERVKAELTRLLRERRKLAAGEENKPGREYCSVCGGARLRSEMGSSVEVEPSAKRSSIC